MSTSERAGSAGEHTPGPWCLVDRDSHQNICDSRGRRLAATSQHRSSDENFPFPVEALANARLISAAPELLEALQCLLRQIDANGELFRDEMPRHRNGVLDVDAASSAIEHNHLSHTALGKAHAALRKAGAL